MIQVRITVVDHDEDVSVRVEASSRSETVREVAERALAALPAAVQEGDNIVEIVRRGKARFERLNGEGSF